MPASLRQELEDTISSLKSQVITRIEAFSKGLDDMYILGKKKLANKLYSELMPEINVMSQHNLLPRMNWLLFEVFFSLIIIIFFLECFSY